MVAVSSSQPPSGAQLPAKNDGTAGASPPDRGKQGDGGSSVELERTQHQETLKQAAVTTRPDQNPDSPWTTGNLVKKLQEQGPVPSADEARRAQMLQGVQDPRDIKTLIATLTRDWVAEVDPILNSDQQKIHDSAMAPSDVRCDESLRGLTQEENISLLAYLRCEIEIPHPPNFIKATLPVVQRAMLEEFHEVHYNAALTADLPASVKLWKNVPHVHVLEILYESNTDRKYGQALMSRLRQDVKRFVYDGQQTLSFVFYSRSAADRWLHCSLRFQKAVIRLGNTARNPEELTMGSFNAAHMKRQYSIKVLWAGQIGLETLTSLFSQLAGVKVLDAQYPRSRLGDIFDNRYHKIVFAQTACPEAQQGVTSIKGEGFMLLTHHYQTDLRAPC